MKREIKGLAVLLAAVLAFTFLGCQPAEVTETPEEFYQGKTIKIVVPFSPGGGTDTQSRIFAPYLAKYTGASVVVENMPGAGGMKGDNYIYNTAEPDGLTLEMSFGDQMTLRYFLGEEGVQYEVPNFSWVGRWFLDDIAVSISKDLPYTTVEGLAGLPEFRAGTTGALGMNVVHIVAFANALGLDNTKIIAGYDSSTDINLAIGQGELHCMVSDLSNLEMFAQKEGFLKLFALIAKERNPKAPDLPTVYELAEQGGQPLTEDSAKWIELLLDMQALRRAFLAPPNVPADRLEFLRDAFWKAIQDKEWQNEWQKAGLPLEGSARGDELQQAAAQLSLTQAEIDDLLFLVTEKYKK